LEELGDIGDPSTMARIARHWAEVAASDRSATAAAARWTVRAGDAALSVAATEEAIAHFERARQWWAGATVEHIETLIKLATALFSSGRTEEADQHYRAALALARGLGQVTLQARAAIGLGRTLVLGQVDPERVAALEEVVDRLDPSESAMRVMVHAMLLRSLLFDRSLATTTRRNEIAGEVLAALDRPDVPTELLIDLGSVRDFLPITDPGPLDRLTRQIVAVAEQRRELLALANGWWGQAWSALERADPVAWAGAVAGHRRAAEQLGSPGELSVSVSLQCVTAQIEGRADDAVVLADLTLQHGRAANDPNADTLRMARSALFALDAGQAAETLPVMIELSRDFANVATFQAGLTLTAAIAGDDELARKLLDDQGTLDFRDVRLDVEWLGVIAFLAHASVLVGDRAHCIALHDLLVKSPATAVRLGSLVGWWGPVDHHLGAMCRVLGRFEEAKIHIERALAIEDVMGAAPFRARSQQELELLGALETGPPQGR
jgi:tetratricopeptide (TPR) repeat protein